MRAPPAASRRCGARAGAPRRRCRPWAEYLLDGSQSGCRWLPGVVHPPHRLLTEERLAALAAEGDERAFGALYRRHEAVLLRYCRSITGDHDDAGDALQNAMLHALGAMTR